MLDGKNDLMEGFYIDFSKSDSFEEVFKCYYAPLCFYARSIVGDYFYEDLVSNVFVKLFEKQMKFKDHSHFLSYIYAAVKNSCLDQIKLTKRRDNRENDYIEDLVANGENDWEIIFQNEVLAETYRELNNLPSQCQRVMKLSYIEGLDNAQIANNLNLSLQTVKNHKYRALKLLKKKLIKLSVFLHIF